MLDALVDRQDRQIAGAGQAPVVVHRGQVAEHLRGPIGLHEHSVDEIRAGQLEAFGGDARGVVGEQVLGVVAQQRGVVHVRSSARSFSRPIMADFGRAATGASWGRPRPTRPRFDIGWGLEATTLPRASFNDSS